MCIIAYEHQLVSIFFDYKIILTDHECAHQIGSEDELAECLSDDFLRVLEGLHGQGKQAVSHLVTDVTEACQRARVWLDRSFSRLRGWTW